MSDSTTAPTPGLGAALWRTRSYLVPHIWHFILFAVLSGIAMLLELAVFLVGFDLLTNKVFRAEPLTALQAAILGLPPAEYVTVETLDESARFTLRTAFLVLMGILLAAGFLLGSGLRYYLTWLLQRVNQGLRLAMMDRAVQLSLKYHQRTEVGDAIYRVYQDSAMVTNVVQNALIQPVIALANLGIALTALTFFSPYLGLLFLIAAVPSALVAWLWTPRLRQRSGAARTANSALTSHIQESVGGARLLKAMTAEPQAFGAFRRRSLAALDRAYELRRSISVLNLLVFLFTAAIVIIADYFMTQWVWAEVPTFGFGLVALVGFAAWNIGAFQAARDRGIALSGIAVSLAQLWGVLQDMGVGLKRAFFLLDVESEVVERPDAVAMPENLSDGVRFRDVSFGYRAGQPVLDGVTFSAAPGTVTAIVGPSGAGKSTLMSLLLRLYDVDDGAVTIDGVDVRDLRLGSLRQGVSIVLQENVLFPSSVADNVRYAAPNADMAAVEAAACIACADEFIADMPEGYDTPLGERGAKLSTGQRQRISIARAVLKDAPILILDEPTASLDVATERRLLERLLAWSRADASSPSPDTPGKKAIFLITHRLDTVRQADHIVFLADGKVVEQGDHETLMAIPEGRYRAFANSDLEAAA